MRGTISQIPDRKEVARSNWVTGGQLSKRTISKPKGMGRSPSIMQCRALIPARGLTWGARRWNCFQNVLICQGEIQGINPASLPPHCLSHPCPCRCSPQKNSAPWTRRGERIWESKQRPSNTDTVPSFWLEQAFCPFPAYFLHRTFHCPNSSYLFIWLLANWQTPPLGV